MENQQQQQQRQHVEDPPLQTKDETPPPPKTGFWGFLSSTSTKVVGAMEYIGETVAGVLGLDDSKFQYVMDGMDKDDWEKAVAIDRERRLEDAIVDAAEELQKKDQELQAEDGGDVEGGAENEGKTLKDYMDMVREQVTTEFWEKEIKENPDVEREIRQVVPDEVEPIERSEEEVVTNEEVKVVVPTSMETSMDETA